VIVTRKLPETIETRMMELFDTRLNTGDRPMVKAELIEAVKTAEILVPTLTDRIDSSVLAHAGPELKLIANYGTGIDHIDVEAAYARGITVTNTPGVLTDDTADMTMALIALPRASGLPAPAIGTAGARLACWVIASPANVWAFSAWEGSARLWPGAHVALGFRFIITTGAVFMRVSKTSWRRPIGRASIKCLLAWTSSASTARIRLRPSICYRPDDDEAALTRMLRNKEIAGAGLDVFEHEPAINPKLRELDNVVLLPHMSSATIEGRLDMGEKVVINIKTFADGHRPPDRVIPSQL